MNNRVYDAALTLALGKIEQGEGKYQAIEDVLWLLRHYIDDHKPLSFCASKKIQAMRSKLRSELRDNKENII